MMGGMRTPEEKDETTLVIARTLAIFVVVLLAGGLVLVLASALGVDVLEPWVRLLIAASALLALVFVVRHRND